MQSSLKSIGPKALASENGLIKECPHLVNVLTTWWPLRLPQQCHVLLVDEDIVTSFPTFLIK